ncbi:MAG: NAD(P)/FAD-dependent oxidoreductase [Pseudotabrizicola sp.]|uniref:flavin-containing monooxygenase n=1 Tax=Pseudotabrizicola sp. TaxID=2939647 RepID=UPI00271AAC72|nr:NAD(P)/FAD-dependent oxidoreductase [Pseudotabrizicola sp.]MDO8883467.1 NAD(P)/FAD-dependent oxidoreductase [Pseudotabrizicola sp.]MDP2082521.1 NAD(P)/FAD-dependent oxidoreductase [Pseudotabrizicola sp.]MDZ7573968.1 NAD(P)/FAD-dependent oxidoreductase [Pseudotabrizicola sp.]
MSPENIDTLVIGGGQAGLATSAHLTQHGVAHLVLERARIAERWRSERWDSLVANGPAWHDRFPSQLFEDIAPDAFPGKERIASYFETFAKKINAPIRCGVEVTALHPLPNGGFRAETSSGVIEAARVVVATGPFQKPLIPDLVPVTESLTQLHSNAYKNPDQLPKGAVLVVGAGSSGAQIAEELQRAGRQVYLSIGPHDRPPRRYRGQDFVWWLGKLGKWDARAKEPGTEHITIAVSGAYGGQTMDFRRLAAQGVVLLGRANGFADGAMVLNEDLAHNIAQGDANYLSVLDEADAYATAHALDLPTDPEARQFAPLPGCVTDPVLSLNLHNHEITSIIWATGFAMDFGWIKADAFDEKGRPVHSEGVSTVPGLYFVGLPWLSCRGSAFIWGAWRDAERLAGIIAARAPVDA